MGMIARWSERLIGATKSDKAMRLLAHEMLNNPAGIPRLMSIATEAQKAKLTPYLMNPRLLMAAPFSAGLQTDTNDE